MSEPVRKLRAELARRKKTLGALLLAAGAGDAIDLIDAFVVHVDSRLCRLEGMGGAVSQYAEQLSEEQLKTRQRPTCEGCEE